MRNKDSRKRSGEREAYRPKWRTFRTEYRKYGQAWEGPLIRAWSLLHAKYKAPRGVKVIGEVEECLQLRS